MFCSLSLDLDFYHKFVRSRYIATLERSVKLLDKYLQWSYFTVMLPVVVMLATDVFVEYHKIIKNLFNEHLREIAVDFSIVRMKHFGN